MTNRKASLEAWRARRHENRQRHQKQGVVAAFEWCVELVASLLIELIEAVTRVIESFAGLMSELSEKHKLWSRSALAVALGIALYATARVFGHDPPNIPSGTAMSYGFVAALVGAVAGLYLYQRNKAASDNPPPVMQQVNVGMDPGSIPPETAPDTPRPHVPKEFP